MGSQQNMKAIVLNEPNEAIRLADVVIPMPTISNNELLVKVEYVGLNPLDAQFAKSGFCQWQYPHVLGLDAVGVVVDAPKGIYPNIGERVMWHANIGSQGVLSEYAKVPNYAAFVVPDEVAPQKAAALPCAGMSALIALEKLQVTDRDTILIDAGAGAVGHFAIQFAKQRGAEVFATASKKNHKLVKSLGADVVYDYRDKNLLKKIQLDIGAQGFDAILDSVGGDNTIRNLELMRFCGRIACLRSLPEFPSNLLFKKAPNISIVSLPAAWLSESLCAQQYMGFMSKTLLENAAKSTFHLPKLNLVEFNAEAVSAALLKQVSGTFTGKQVVKVVEG